ncbi:DBH-like monooxygenase protein 1, partial [Orchesella cincta]
FAILNLALGRAIQLVHIRDNKELPWILNENNYNFNYQQNRILRNETLILPGDTIITRCSYETTDRNGSVTVGGFSTRNEMCNGFFWYYNRIPGHGICRSSIRSDIYRSFVDIWNTTWSNPRIEMVVTSPRQNAGLVVSEVGNSIDWTIERRNQLQKYHQCPRLIFDAPTTQPPPLRRYTPPRRTPTNNIAPSSVENEILDPEYEYVSEYPKDIVRYEKPDVCRRRK